VIDILNRLRGPFNISNEAQAMALEALADQDFVEHSRRHNAEVRAASSADRSPGQPRHRMVPSEANFRAGAVRRSAERRSGLQRAGRGAATSPAGAPPPAFRSGVRITIGTAEQMDAIATVLRDLAEAAR
jgi:histidinol-phosphate aminotransferase